MRVPANLDTSNSTAHPALEIALDQKGRLVAEPVAVAVRWVQLSDRVSLGVTETGHIVDLDSWAEYSGCVEESFPFRLPEEDTQCILDLSGVEPGVTLDLGTGDELRDSARGIVWTRPIGTQRVNWLKLGANLYIGLSEESALACVAIDLLAEIPRGRINRVEGFRNS